MVNSQCLPEDLLAAVIYRVGVIRRVWPQPSTCCLQVLIWRILLDRIRALIAVRLLLTSVLLQQLKKS